MPVLLTLGEITFLNTEIPPKINSGGKQILSVKKLLGGQRVIDSIGFDPDDISWSGMFFGENAEFRARFLDGITNAGSTVLLTYSGYRYNVVIKHFSASFEAPWQIPYSITVCVLEDLTNPITILPLASFNDEIQNALLEANDISFLLQNDPIAGAMAALNDLSQNVNFSNATVAEINSVFSAAQTVQSVTSGQIGSLAKEIFG